MTNDPTEKIYATWATLDEARPPPGAVGVRELYLLFRSPDYELSHEQTRRLFTDPWLRQLFETIKAGLTVQELPQVAAAATGAIFEREFPGGRLSIIESTEAPFHSYLLVKFDEPRLHSCNLKFWSSDGRFEIIEIPLSDETGEVLLPLGPRGQGLAAKIDALKDPNTMGLFLDIE